MRFPQKTLFLLGLALAALPAPELAAQRTPFEGTFVYVAEGSDNVEQAIEAAVRPMNFVKRPIARGRLKKTNPIYRSVVIGQTPQEIRVATDDRPPLAAPADGSAIQWKREDGETFDVSMAWKNGGLEQTFAAEDGRRVNFYTLSPDGNLLTLRVTVSSPQLPKPVTYKLNYRRQR